jgi:hypothetical protein
MMLKASYSATCKVEIEVRGVVTSEDRQTLGRLALGLRLVGSGCWILDNPQEFSDVPLIGNILRDYDRQIKLPM